MAFTALWTEHGFWCIENDGVRAFLFEGKEKALLIDTTRSAGLGEFVKTLTDKPVMVATTHADGDHTASDNEFTEQYIHPSEFDYYSAKAPMPKHVQPIWEGGKLDIGTFCFEAVLIPGHTPGSLLFLERGKRFAIGGDSIQTGTIYMFGAGRNFNSYVASMEKLLGYMDAVDTIYSSHNELMISPSMIPELLEGAKGFMRGEATYEDAPGRMPSEVKIATCGKAHFFAKKPE